MIKNELASIELQLLSQGVTGTAKYIHMEMVYKQYIAELEKDYSDLEYKFSCILDHATGSRASKTNIDKDIAYKLIDENVNFWVNSAVEELEHDNRELSKDFTHSKYVDKYKELETPKTYEGCDGCMYQLRDDQMAENICTECSRYYCDFHKPMDSK